MLGLSLARKAYDAVLDSIRCCWKGDILQSSRFAFGSNFGYSQRKASIWSNRCM